MRGYTMPSREGGRQSQIPADKTICENALIYKLFATNIVNKPN